MKIAMDEFLDLECFGFDKVFPRCEFRLDETEALEWVAAMRRAGRDLERKAAVPLPREPEEIQTFHEVTPLAFAARCGLRRVLAELIDAGCDPKEALRSYEAEEIYFPKCLEMIRSAVERETLAQSSPSGSPAKGAQRRI